MKTWQNTGLHLATLTLVLFATGIRLCAQQSRAGQDSIYPPSEIAGATNPDIMQQNIAENICSKNWSTSEVRPSSSYTTHLKKQQMAAWKFPGTSADYEEDHLISLENGGCPKCSENLWPEAYGDSNQPMSQRQRSQWDKAHPGSSQVLPGALQKDKVESYVHDEVCLDIPNAKFNSPRANRPTESITLRRAQEILAQDWYMCYLKMKYRMACK
jgi:hypothetical protein